jgi:hypothetical protein
VILVKFLQITQMSVELLMLANLIINGKDYLLNEINIYLKNKLSKWIISPELLASVFVFVTLLT